MSIVSIVKTSSLHFLSIKLIGTSIFDSLNHNNLFFDLRECFYFYIESQDPRG